jgi:ATPase subunit of ABC transporter with duplicated ATPase domains
LLDRVATKVAELQDGKLHIYHGGWTAYREARGELPAALAHEAVQQAGTAAA